MEKVAGFWKKSDKLTLVPVISSFFTTLLIVTIFAIVYNQLPEKLPLFYSLPWGPTQLAGKQQFFLLPCFLIGVTAINALIASQLHPVQLALKRTLTLSLILIDLIILITALKILFIFV